jgi:hypothetical protein
MTKRRAARGEAMGYLLAVLTTLPTECTTWPFATNMGRAVIGVDGRPVFVHSIVCSWYHGPCPPGLECCHSCGHGYQGCFNPRHLRWDTRQANADDRVRHRIERRQAKDQA